MTLGETILYWNNGFGYTPVEVDESAKPYEPALNAVLSAIYNGIVSDRLENDKMHVAYVLLNNGKVTSVSCYADKTDTRGGRASGITSDELSELNKKIQQSLAGKDYKLCGAGTERVFFDWDGNVVSNVGADGKYTGIGGQGASASLGLVPTDGGKKISLENRTGVWHAK